MSGATSVCFTRGRIKFYNEEGVGNSPTSGHAFFYFGPNVETFAARFGEIGFVYSNEQKTSSRMEAAYAA